MSDPTLILLRHAKAEPPERYRVDADRPLSVRGHADARAAGAWLAERGLVPDLVLCSPALRTRETWQEVAEALAGARPGGEATVPAEPAVRFEPELYDGPAESLLRTVAHTPGDVHTLLVVGHNPTLSIASGYLDPAGGDGSSLRTAGIAVHRVPGTWAACTPRVARLALAHTARA